jgi:hypothetical protein
MSTTEGVPSQLPLDAAGAPSPPAPLFFPVSLLKLTLLGFFTFGFYELYWFYKNWRIIKERERLNIQPFWRAFFAYFFCYPLFRRVRDSAREAGAGDLAAGPLAVGWIILTALWKLPDPYWLVTALAPLCLLPVQRSINRINAIRAPGHEPNARFSAWNIVVVVIGVPLFILGAMGAFIPDQG